jgi:hypothetical protein
LIKEQRYDRLTLQSCSYIQNMFFGLLFFFMGALFSLGIFLEWEQDNQLIDLVCRIFSALLTLGSLFLGVRMISSFPTLTTFDRITGTVTIQHGIYFKKQIEQYRLSDVKAVELYSLSNPDSIMAGYSVNLVISEANHKGIPKEKRFQISGTFGGKRQRAKAELVGSFLGFDVQVRSN